MSEVTDILTNPPMLVTQPVSTDERTCMDCGTKIDACMGFVHAGDWNKYVDGKSSVVRERCGTCIELLNIEDSIESVQETLKPIQCNSCQKLHRYESIYGLIISFSLWRVALMTKTTVDVVFAVALSTLTTGFIIAQIVTFVLKKFGQQMSLLSKPKEENDRR